VAEVRKKVEIFSAKKPKEMKEVNFNLPKYLKFIKTYENSRGINKYSTFFVKFLGTPKIL